MLLNVMTQSGHNTRRRRGGAPMSLAPK